jgi:hypothetical protein
VSSFILSHPKAQAAHRDMARQCRELADQAEAIELRRRKHVAKKNGFGKLFQIIEP